MDDIKNMLEDLEYKGDSTVPTWSSADDHPIQKNYYDVVFEATKTGVATNQLDVYSNFKTNFESISSKIESMIEKIISKENGDVYIQNIDKLFEVLKVRVVNDNPNMDIELDVKYKYRTFVFRNNKEFIVKLKDNKILNCVNIAG